MSHTSLDERKFRTSRTTHLSQHLMKDKLNEFKAKIANRETLSNIEKIKEFNKLHSKVNVWKQQA
ncbi:uncharacterized protein G2W53_007250 [Senna tora]|uniref:Uncharacterized protein n=1 Tax=Senna tora TaxID=362788 RepID=A0A834X7A7_9FABA|nr:uncharacterized protein G2W53_007250 [Senna tora]